jgi:alpha-ketoglutarate-dependent taurine dioxygenase
MSLSVRKLTSRIGAVIEGVDLAAEPSGETIARAAPDSLKSCRPRKGLGKLQ